MPPEAALAGGDHAPADYGLFGPASVSWRVMAAPVLWTAAFRALYLQALHPRVMRGTWQHMAFADPDQAWGRFLRTAEFVRVRTYGSLAEVERAGRRVRKLHASLRGGAAPDRGAVTPARRRQRGTEGTFQELITGSSCSVPSVLSVPVSSRNRRPAAGSRRSQRAVSTRSR
jgi:hypothetical protein